MIKKTRMVKNGEQKFRLNFSRHTNREEASLKSVSETSKTANKLIMFKLLNFKTTKIYKIKRIKQHYFI